MNEPLKVGSRLWREHSQNPTFQTLWAEVAIVGETSRSWLVGYPRKLEKLPKAAFRNGQCPVGWARSQEHVLKLEWVHKHRYRIAEHVRCVKDYDALRQIAALVGYGTADKKEE